jgi:alpha-beta hydrolase superfamily lysophospholipase
MNPSQGSIQPIGIEVRVDRSTALPGRVWCAERPRGIVAIVHGLGDHGGRFGALASELAVRGRCTAVALDLPGHGDAPGSRGDFPSWEVVREQVLPAMFTAMRGLPDQPFDLPRVLLGHSMGAVLALDYALAHGRELKALVLSAPALRSKMPPWWKLALANIARATAPSSGFPHGLDLSGLSRDAEVRRLYDEDARVHGKISPRLYFALEEARQRCLRDARRLQVPTLLLQGMADRVVDPRGALEFSGAATHGVVRFVTLKDTYHELFNDPGREAVIQDMIAWLDAALVV